MVFGLARDARNQPDLRIDFSESLGKATSLFRLFLHHVGELAQGLIKNCCPSPFPSAKGLREGMVYLVQGRQQRIDLSHSHDVLQTQTCRRYSEGSPKSCFV